MRLTYFDTLYQREVTIMIIGEVEFKKHGVSFDFMGQKCFVEYEYMRKIEEV